MPYQPIFTIYRDKEHIVVVCSEKPLEKSKDGFIYAGKEIIEDEPLANFNFNFGSECDSVYGETRENYMLAKFSVSDKNIKSLFESLKSIMPIKEEDLESLLV